MTLYCHHAIIDAVCPDRGNDCHRNRPRRVSPRRSITRARRTTHLQKLCSAVPPTISTRVPRPESSRRAFHPYHQQLHRSAFHADARSLMMSIANRCAAVDVRSLIPDRHEGRNPSGSGCGCSQQSDQAKRINKCAIDCHPTLRVVRWDCAE